ncbi:MAG: hypothetical protein WC708_07720 [Lentisphaeria bacterium]
MKSAARAWKLAGRGGGILLLAAGSLANGAPWSLRQELQVEFASTADAAQATLMIADLPEDKDWAVSVRWDCQLPDNGSTRDILVRHGLKGTVFLPAPDPAGQYDAVCRRASGGFSIGGRLTGPATPPPVRTANQLFQEILDTRLEWECQTDRPVVAFSFPAGSLPMPADPVFQEALARALLNAGIQLTVNLEVLRGNPHLPPEDLLSGWPVKLGSGTVDLPLVQAQLDKLAALKPAYQKQSRLFFLSGRANLDAAGLVRLDRLGALLARHDNWWYCTLNEYAAYERQRRLCRLRAGSAGPGPGRSFILERPMPAELGTRVPLTALLDRPVTAVRLDLVPVTVKRYGSRIQFQLPLPPGWGLPERIDRIDNPRNRATPPAGVRSREFPGLLAWLCADPAGSRVILTLRNQSAKPVTAITVAALLPPACQAGRIQETTPDLAPGETRRLSFPLRHDRTGAFWQDGSQRFASSVDFTAAGQPGRLYATTLVE